MTSEGRDKRAVLGSLAILRPLLRQKRAPFFMEQALESLKRQTILLSQFASRPSKRLIGGGPA